MVSYSLTSHPFSLYILGSIIFFFITKVHTLKEERVIGGETAYAGQFNFLAAIHVTTESSKFFCGGCLLSQQWVLTAGHCVNGARLFTIQLGSMYLTADDSNRITVASSEYVVHPEFNPDTIENDIGLIKFRIPISLSPYIRPIPLPVTELKNSTSNAIRILGWGQTSDFDPELSENLKYAYVTILSTVECKMTYGEQITEKMICVEGRYNEGTCTGDNGGPLLENISSSYWVDGIASFISGNGCESTDPSGYTRTWPYIEWINSTINEK